MHNHNNSDHALLAGTLYGIAAFGIWGILPVYWKLLSSVPALEILAHRIFWSCVFASMLLLSRRRWHTLGLALATWHNRFALLLSASFVSVNWFIYIWAVNSGQIVEASMGYYINPLFSVLLGLLILRERMYFWQYIAVGLATIGVVIMTARYGKIPWIALGLAVSFGLYGLLKKTVPIDSLAGLMIETMLVSPLCVGLMVSRYVQGTAAFGLASLKIHLLLIFAGVVTAIPLLCFAQAAKLIPLSRVGFLQYLSPTLSLLLGVFLYGEQFTRTHLISFGLIWAALLLYSLSQWGFLKPRYQKNEESCSPAPK